MPNPGFITNAGILMGTQRVGMGSGKNITPQSVTTIDQLSSISAQKPDGSYDVTVSGASDGGAGIRYWLPLNQLVGGLTYIATIIINNPDGTVMADACDGPDLGPFAAGQSSFSFSRPAYDATYRFIDVWIAEEYEGGFFNVRLVSVIEQ